MSRFMCVVLAVTACIGCANEDQNSQPAFEELPAMLSDHVKSAVKPPAITNVSVASVSVTANDETEYIFTASQDGRKLYMWQRIGAKPPKFVGESDAVLSE